MLKLLLAALVLGFVAAIRNFRPRTSRHRRLNQRASAGYYQNHDRRR